MTETLHPNDGLQTDIFKNSNMPTRGFLAELLTLLTKPIQFFTELGNRRVSPHTRLISLLILVVMAVTALQMPTQDTTQTVDVPFEQLPTDSGMPFDPGFPPPDGGMVDGGGTATEDPTTKWITVLTTISKQVMIWGTLTILLSIIMLANGYMPPFGKNLEIAIWASVPLALMAGLQLAFISGGGTINANGFSGFLDEWGNFATLDLRLQSVIHAFAEQVTLFWLWGLWLLYIGMRFTLRGKRVIVLFTLMMWVVLSTLVYSFRSYDVLTSTAPPMEEPMPMDDLPMDMPTDSEMLPDGEFPQDIPSDEMIPDGELAMDESAVDVVETVTESSEWKP